MDIERMSKEQLEEFVGAELVEIGSNIYATVDGKFAVKHVSHVTVEGIEDPYKLRPDWKSGYNVEVRDKNFRSKAEARKWLKQAYKLYKHILASEEWRNDYNAKHGYSLALGRDATVVRRRLQRMNLGK